MRTIFIVNTFQVPKPTIYFVPLKRRGIARLGPGGARPPLRSPPLSPFPHANSFIKGTAVVNTHTHTPANTHTIKYHKRGGGGVRKTQVVFKLEVKNHALGPTTGTTTRERLTVTRRPVPVRERLRDSERVSLRDQQTIHNGMRTSVINTHTCRYGDLAGKKLCEIVCSK